jgi:protein SCO1/2
MPLKLRPLYCGYFGRHALALGQFVPFLMMMCALPAFAVVEPKVTVPKPPCCREGLPPGKYSEQSLYRLDATWTSDVGREVKLEVLRGRPQVIALFFTNCEHSCPLIVADMKAIDRAVPSTIRGKVDFLLVSIDPERDTPEALRAFRDKHALPTERWTLLRGSPEATRELASLIGFNFQPGSPTQFAHSLLISIVNEAGEIIYQQAGVGRPPTEAVAALARTSKIQRKR